MRFDSSAALLTLATIIVFLFVVVLHSEKSFLRKAWIGNQDNNGGGGIAEVSSNIQSTHLNAIDNKLSKLTSQLDDFAKCADALQEKDEALRNLESKYLQETSALQVQLKTGVTSPVSPPPPPPVVVAAPPPPPVIKNTFYRSETQQFNLCVGNCGQHGVGSHFSIKAHYLNMSQELGFKLHWMNFFRDANRPSDTDAYIQPVLPGASYYPEKCDAYFGDPHINCFHKDYIEAMASDLYHVQMFNLYASYYSPKLRVLATALFQELYQEFGQDTVFVGVHIRDDFQYTAYTDIRSSRKIGESDYETIQSYLEGKIGQERRIVYLVQGDLSVSRFKTTKEFVLVEDWIKNRKSVQQHQVTRLQLMFLGIDVCSRLKFRMITKFSNNFPLHMGMHRLNNNMNDVLIGDVFSLRSYDYFGKQIDVLGQVDLKPFPKNPYEYFPDARAAQKGALDCFRNFLFGTEPIPPDSGARSECNGKFDKFEPIELGRAPFYQTDFF